MRLVSISEIKISGLNERIYRPISNDDPAIQELASSIEKDGILDPLVLSEDFYIISGHRRYAASQLAGLTMLPCFIRKGVKKDSDEFLKLLREFNRHRVKGVEEYLRESIIDVSDTRVDTELNLIIDRARRSYIEDEPMEIVGKKVRAEITQAKYPFLKAIIRVVQDRKPYWPLSDRASYQALCELLTRARLKEYIPWQAIADPTRPVTQWDVYPSVEPFIHEQMGAFLQGYWRDYTKSQPHHIEIIGEKNTLQSIIQPVAMDFCIPVTIGRGYSSLQPRYELSQRYKNSGKNKLVLLILSDHDPDGDEIAQSFCRSMRDDFDIENIHPVRVALTKEQVELLRLPPIMQAKTTSNNYAKFVTKHGHDVFELEAVPPENLQQILKAAILSVVDIDALNREREQEQSDKVEIQKRKRLIMDAMI